MLLAALLVVSLPMVAAPVRAADGDLDPAFGAGGRVVTDLGSPLSASVGAVLVQPDGKIVAVGTWYPSDLSPNGKFALARYSGAGVLDSAFGAGGIVASAVGGVATAALLQPDNRIVVVGRNGGQVLVARFLVDGTLDASFGTGGMVTTFLGGSGLEPMRPGAALQSDGKIVVVGDASDIAVIRYEANGILDAGFGTAGIASVPGTAEGFAVLVQSDGRIVIGGRREIFPEPLLVRMEADGSALDAGFGVGGKVVLAGFGDLGTITGLVQLPDGGFVAAADAEIFSTSDGVLGLVRVDAAGALVSSFGSGGFVVLPLVRQRKGSLLRQPDGRLLASGAIGYYPAVLRFEADGGIDPTFSACVAGVVAGDRAPAMAPQGDGRIVLGGSLRVELPLRDAIQVARLGSVATPECQAAATGKSRFSVANGKVKWTWKGGSVAKADFGDPSEGNGVLCAVDASTSMPLNSWIASGADACLWGPCWAEKATGYLFKNGFGSIVKLLALSTGIGKLKVTDPQAQGALPPLPAPTPLLVRYKRGDGGACWEATYSAPRANLQTLYKAVSD